MATRAEVVIKKRRHLSDSSHEESINVIHLRKQRLSSRFEARRIESSHALRRDTGLLLYLQTAPTTRKDFAYFTAQEDSSPSQDGFLLTKITSGCFKSTAHEFVVVSSEIRYEGYAVGCGLECLDVAHGLLIGLVHCVIVLKFGGRGDEPSVRRAVVRKLECGASLKTTRGRTSLLPQQPTATLHRRDLTKLGQGSWFQSHRTEFFDLYEDAEAQYGDLRQKSKAAVKDAASISSQCDPDFSHDGSFPTEITYGGQERLFLFVGRDPNFCHILIGGSQIVLELIDHDEGPLVRRVLLQRLNLESQEALETAIMVQGKEINLEKEPLVLPRGCLVRFGRGPWDRYYKPQYQDLYEEADQLYGEDPRANSSVHRARRIHDGQAFVTKTITATHTHTNIARTELFAYMEIESHSNMVWTMESFHPPNAELYRIILVKATTDLHTFLLRLRPEGQADLTAMASIWVDQLTSGFQHVHKCGMAHRDVKQENVLVFVPRARADYHEDNRPRSCPTA